MYTRGVSKSSPLIGIVLLALVAPSGLCRASNYTGQIVDIRSQPSPTTAGNIRVSIQISGTTNCTATGNGTWYSYDLPDGATSKLWGATLVAALVSARNVGIGGTGTCDAWGIEMVSYMDGM